jgi:hypothetical protein
MYTIVVEKREAVDASVDARPSYRMPIIFVTTLKAPGCGRNAFQSNQMEVLAIYSLTLKPRTGSKC